MVDKPMSDSYKEAYKEFIDKLSGIEAHYETGEGQNTQFSIAIQDEYEKFWEKDAENSHA